MIEKSLEISLIVLFIHATTWEGMIMNWIKKYVPSKYWISKPIYSCPICMTPYWGFLILLLFNGRMQILNSVMILLCACGFSVVSVVLIDIMDYCKSRTIKPDKCC